MLFPSSNKPIALNKMRTRYELMGSMPRRVKVANTSSRTSKTIDTMNNVARMKIKKILSTLIIVPNVSL